MFVILHMTEGIVGFCFPLSCQEDVERLENTIHMSPIVKSQYIRYLASKKAPNEPVSKCFKLFFSHWSVYNFCLHSDHHRGATDCKKQCMKEYTIFTECMMEAWKSHRLSEANLFSELQIALTAAYETSNQSDYKRRKRSELIQMMLRQKQTKLTK
uniref:DUF4806 domain-containing protein n=1 Tax=Anopheles culicifacies TaxID=139723 RepID=A0A182M4H1_9DIPT